MQARPDKANALAAKVATPVATVAHAVVVAAVVAARAMRQPDILRAVELVRVAQHQAGGVPVAAIALTAMPNPRVRMPIWAPTVVTVCRPAAVLAAPASPTPCAPALTVC